jgi:hypothetical protein
MKESMRVYLALQATGYEFCRPSRQDDFETVNVQINGASRGATWKPIPVHIVHEDRGRSLKPSDAPWLESHALVFRPKASRALETLLLEHGELLPLACDEAPLAILNVTRVVDALDEQASDITRFSSGRVMMVNRHVFHADAIGNAAMFKIPNLRVSPTFVTQRFIDAWGSAGLEGLQFKPLCQP